MSQAPLTRSQVREIVLESLEEVLVELRVLSRTSGMTDPIVVIWKAVRNCLDKPEATHEGRGT
jgi:hypothetical protein